MNKNLHTAIKASIEAGKAIMDIYETDFEVSTKQDESPLTEADQNANAIINQYLKPTGVPIISEENKQIDYNDRKNWEHCWIVDPLDGTKEFVKRNGEFTVNIAYVKQGIPEFGVIYVPATKVLYFGDLSIGKSFKVLINSDELSFDEIFEMSQEICSDTTEDQLVRLVGSRSHMNEATLDFIQKLEAEGKQIEVVSKGSSLKFCLVAEGKADIYPRYAPTMEWDTAAGQAICNAVGIAVIDKTTNKPLAYNKEDLLNPWFTVLKEN